MFSYFLLCFLVLHVDLCILRMSPGISNDSNVVSPFPPLFSPFLYFDFSGNTNGTKLPNCGSKLPLRTVSAFHSTHIFIILPVSPSI